MGVAKERKARPVAEAGDSPFLGNSQAASMGHRLFPVGKVLGKVRAIKELPETGHWVPGLLGSDGRRCDG